VEENKKTRLGVVFNLDKHNQPGSHWVAMFMSWNSGQCCYWDSYGMRPNPEVVKLMNRLQEQARQLEKEVIIKINKKRHQYKNTECGVYCIYFLTSFLEDLAFEEIVGNIINDDKMFEKRKDFFVKV
jgi:Ulp1 family protease